MYKNIMQEFEDLMNGISAKNNSISPEKMELYQSKKNDFLTKQQMVEDFKSKIADVQSALAGQLDSNATNQVTQMKDELRDMEYDLDADREELREVGGDDVFYIDEDLQM